ncbi:C-5 cytosine-specific DNA methylase [Burkholderia pseudomallei]|uniref:DNA cytosine methyltransferase n=1 Tax=Burkholderia pseudomallei TaxID=28450 RepID=UPI0005E9C5BB|nr:C-5 cytosine-specific DNA methylase [Burkholderia pseudomallei]CFB52714.1 C-5 cytosine-specific DNA methylase [Burkholderia pseudomallei]CFD93056.1 C-5 cytosine-specific DNA methylase [Burkholderia pseudomallei]CFK82737.1 C-5 cytosine-specific DNA methylase [Burkholderia pseudomallei]CFK91779.1 C-5 cytosine-specific DNA methylase [Burkholderia pseudomallei]
MNTLALRYGSVCSGIEAVSVAWQPLGLAPAWFAEIDPFANAVLDHHYPHVPNLGDMTGIAPRIRAGTVDTPDILVGGTPCQSFSVAGRRQGLADPRGALTLHYVEIAHEIDQARLARRHPRPSSSGKTCRACSPTGATPLDAFLARWLGKHVRWSHQGRGGRTLVVSMDPNDASPGGYWTPNISVSPNDASVCSLSQVLETTSIPPRYFLSSTACSGILRRTAKRHKALPEALQSALMAAASRR